MSEAARTASGSPAGIPPEREWGAAAHPAVTVELYGTLRIRAGRPAVALRSDSIRTALRLLREALPALARHLPPEADLPRTHRFSINGGAVTTDLDAPLREGDHLVLFSASVGG
jgi:molybdopterin converting factor small subunit